MTIELPERHPSPPFRPCTEPNSETFETLRRARLLLMNLVRDGVLHRSEYGRLMRRTIVDHFVVDGPRYGTQLAGGRDVMVQLLDLIDRGAFVKGVDLVDWNQLPGCIAISTRAVYEAFSKERSIGDAALREALRVVQADHPQTVIGLSEKVLFRSKHDRRRAIVLHLENARLFAAGGDPTPQDPLVTKLEDELIGDREQDGPASGA
jgi:hypothetical protein